MATIYVDLYFNEKKGYIVQPFTDSPNTIGSIKAMRPPHTFRLSSDIDTEALGQALVEARADAEAGVPAEEPGFHLKELVRFAGMRSERQFDKAYRNLLLEYGDEGALTVFECLPEADGAWPTREASPYVEVPAGAGDVEVGAAVLSLLARESDIPPRVRTARVAR